MCSALTRLGEPCRAYAKRGSEPPLCAAHAGGVGAPLGNKNRWKHGYYSKLRPRGHCGPPGPDKIPAHGEPRDLTRIEEIIADLAERQAALTAYLERVLADEGDLADAARVFALHGQNASRLGRLLRDQRALSGGSADGLLEAIGKALDEISTELGIKL